MDKETKRLVLGFGTIAIMIVVAYGVLVALTGFSLPFSSVVSESMQHDNDRSEIGVIDTGDIVIVADPSKVDIQSYVMGTQTDYRSFGDYGSVIIYERDPHKNPVIHRAMVWLDYDPNTGLWSSMELMNYEKVWYYLRSDGTIGTDKDSISGRLIFKDMAGKSEVSINLDNLAVKQSGYLTMGDNVVTNPNFDQSSGIVNHLVPMEDIRSVAKMEIPWMGIPKLMINGNDNLDRVPNSLPSLIMGILVVFSFMILIDAFYIYRFQLKTEKEIDSVIRWKRL